MPPSSLQCLIPLYSKNMHKRVNSFVNWLKIRILWPDAMNFGIMRSKSSNLPDDMYSQSSIKKLFGSRNK